MPRQVSISHASLIEICRILRHSLNAGISIVKVFSQQAVKGPSDFRLIAARITQRLKRGDDLTSAMASERAFPPLMLSLVTVGEQTGHLPEIFTDLEEYFRLQQQIRRTFRAKVFMPAIQFVIAVLIIAVLIWILGSLDLGPDAPAGGLFGLSGAMGALVFIGIALGSVLVVVLGLRFFFRKQAGKVWLDTLLLRIPLLGGCLQSLALSRFALAMSLTLDSGMPIAKAVRMSLKASGNASYEEQGDFIERELQQGETLASALNGAGILPDDFRHILSTAEQSGRIPEAMRHQYKRYHEEGERQMKALAQMAVWVIWVVYAIFMIVMIFRIARVYFGVLPK